MSKTVHFYYWENSTAEPGRIACMNGITFHLSQSPVIEDITCEKCLNIIKQKKIKERASWEF